MLALAVGIIAILLGVLVGFWLRDASGRSEKDQLTLRVQELAGELNAGRAELGSVRAELARTQAESAAKNAFEALAGERERALGQLAAERDGVRGELAALASAESKAQARISGLESELRAERAKLAEQLALLNEAKKSLSDQFEALAGRILDEKSKSFSEGSQKELGVLIAPLRTQIEDFRKKVEETQTDSKTGVAKLEGLIGNLNGLNQQLAAEAKNLATALRGSNKAQGDWGEFILRDLLEKSGLREGEQYSFQQSFAGVAAEDDGRTKTARTDVIVFLPGGRNLVIDSKVSLTAYSDYANAASDVERAAALKLHLASVRNHLAGLSRAGYHNLPGIETPDFVVMFVPVEPAFLVALQAEPDLWSEAYGRGILLVSPTTLLYVIRIVNILWQQEAQSRNVREVMDRGTELYDKFVNFVADLEKVGAGLRAADASYANAMKKLAEGRGNLIRQAEMLKGLGIRSTKSLPRTLLDQAGADGIETEPTLALAAEAKSSF
jgi:DNA recombination protein RmuC